MLDSKLTEQLDKTVFTPEFLAELNEQMEAEVEVKAQNLAASKIAALEEASDKYKHFLDKACQDYLNQYKINLNEKVDMYLSQIARDFVSENQEKLDAIAESAKGNAMYSLFERIADILGKDLSNVSKENEIAVSEEVQKLKDSINKLHRELTEAKAERYEALKANALLVASRDMTIPQMQKLNAIYELSESNLTASGKADITEDEIDRRVNEAIKVLKQGNKPTFLSEDFVGSEPEPQAQKSTEPSWKHLV